MHGCWGHATTVPAGGPCWLVAVPCMRSLSCIALQHAHTMPLLALLPCSYVMPDQRTVYGTDDGTNVRWEMEGWLAGWYDASVHVHAPAHLSRCSATAHLILAVQLPDHMCSAWLHSTDPALTSVVNLHRLSCRSVSSSLWLTAAATCPAVRGLGPMIDAWLRRRDQIGTHIRPAACAYPSACMA